MSEECFSWFSFSLGKKKQEKQQIILTLVPGIPVYYVSKLKENAKKKSGKSGNKQKPPARKIRNITQTKRFDNNGPKKQGCY